MAEPSSQPDPSRTPEPEPPGDDTTAVLINLVVSALGIVIAFFVVEWLCRRVFGLEPGTARLVALAFSVANVVLLFVGGRLAARKASRPGGEDS